MKTFSQFLAEEDVKDVKPGDDDKPDAEKDGDDDTPIDKKNDDKPVDGDKDAA
jgi:hypothetical protein